MVLRRIGRYLAYLAFRLLVCFVQALRLETCCAGCRALAWVLARVIKLRAGVVDENLRLAFPHLSDAARQRLALEMWEHLLLLVVEVAHARRLIHQANWRRYVVLRGAAQPLRLLLSGRPLILVSAHYGNFELGGYVLGLLGIPTWSVARPLDNPQIDAYVRRVRGATGQRLIPKKGGYDQIRAVLQEGGVIAFLADQYAGSKGCWVDFFGRPASAHKAIALLAMEHQAPVAVVTTRRLGSPLRYEFALEALNDPLQGGPEWQSVRALTQWYTSVLEQAIRRAPEQYWWIHRRWKDRRPLHRRRRQAA
ncbi:MAG: lysophospholipid acyltransferase family protein [Pirellulales bacterium]|nr:lysophospholipid acyltransferase family protein [Pirellulales bacterium]